MSKIDWDKPLEYKLYFNGVEEWVPCKVVYFNSEFKSVHNRLCEYVRNDQTYDVVWIDKDGWNMNTIFVRNKKEKIKRTWYVKRRLNSPMQIWVSPDKLITTSDMEIIDTIEREYEI